MKKRMMRTKELMAKKRWLSSDWMKETWDVRGSISHWKAPTDVQKALRQRITRQRWVCGRRLDTDSVSRRSKAFRSGAIRQGSQRGVAEGGSCSGGRERSDRG